MNRPLVAALALVVAACGTATDASTTSMATSCQEPPREELEMESTLDVMISPNPASPREIVELTVLKADLSDDAVVGVDAEWQCWDGSRWVTTHFVYRGFGDNPGQTIPVNAEFRIRVPSIGLALDEGYPIVIPQVAPGTYRVEDAALADGDTINGFALVEVVEG
ncbi:MAG TPA: hypothetical protein VF148_05400 [Acidimicrobiia bacterium]